jgi:hypothetical protein
VAHEKSRRWKAITLAVLTGAALLGGAVYALIQAGPGPGAIYQRNSVSSVSGRVVAIDSHVMEPGLTPGVHLLVTTSKGIVVARLGPVRYVERQRTKIKVGDEVTIVGSRGTLRGKPALVAAEVKKGDQLLRLRRVKSGMPYWGREEEFLPDPSGAGPTATR